MCNPTSTGPSPAPKTCSPRPPAATGEKAAELRARALEQLKALRERLHEAQAVALERSKAAAHATDEYVHDHPWRSIARRGERRRASSAC